MSNNSIFKYWFMEMITDESGNENYFSMINSDDFYMYDTNKNVVKKIGHYPLKKSSIQMYRGGVMIGEKVYFAPRMTRYLAIYDKNSKKFEFVDAFEEFNNPYKLYFEPTVQGFMCTKDSNGNGWLIFGNSPICLKIDAITGKVSYVSFDNYCSPYILGTDYVIEDDVLLAPIVGKNELFRLDFINGKIDFLNIGNFDEKYFSITKGEDKVFYLLAYNKPAIVKWDYRNNKITKMADLPLTEIRYDQALWIRKHDQTIRVFPGLDVIGGNNKVFSYSLKNNLLTEENTYVNLGSKIKWPMHSDESKTLFFMCDQNENAFMSQNGKYIYYDWVKNTIDEVNLPTPDEELLENLSLKIENFETKNELDYYYKQNISTEGQYLDLEHFIYGIINDYDI